MSYDGHRQADIIPPTLTVWSRIHGVKERHYRGKIALVQLLIKEALQRPHELNRFGGLSAKPPVAFVNAVCSKGFVDSVDPSEKRSSTDYEIVCGYS